MLPFLFSIAGSLWIQPPAMLDRKGNIANNTENKAPRGNTNEAQPGAFVLPRAGSEQGKIERPFD